MKYPMIKQPSIYRAELPALEKVQEGVSTLPFNELPIGSSLVFSRGFIVNEVTGELVTPIEGGYAFAFRSDDKVIPTSEIIKRTAERVKAATDLLSGKKLSKAERLAIRDDVVAELAARAFTKTTVLECYYHAANKLLFVNGSKKMAGFAVGALVKAIGQVATTTIHIDGVKVGLTNLLKPIADQTNDDFSASGFAGLEVLGSIKLEHPDTGERLGFDGITPSDCEELRSAMDRGFLVTSIRMGDDVVSFTLNSSFEIGGVKWSNTKAEGDDMAFAWRTEASIQLLCLTGIVERLIAELQKGKADEQ